jgi:hypothetical protein
MRALCLGAAISAVCQVAGALLLGPVGQLLGLVLALPVWWCIVWPPPRRRITDTMRYALWRWQDIPCHGELYLRKLYLVRTPLFQVALNWFNSPDPDRAPHDHPRDFVSILLRGGYIEERYRVVGRSPLQTGTTKRTRILGVAFRRAESLHRISAVKPNTTTLVLWGRQRRAWGFQTMWGWRLWKDYLA